MAGEPEFGYWAAGSDRWMKQAAVEKMAVVCCLEAEMALRRVLPTVGRWAKARERETEEVSTMARRQGEKMEMAHHQEEASVLKSLAADLSCQYRLAAASLRYVYRLRRRRC
jgi:hypothetical protein